jgi:hypothetical protein
MVNDIAAADVPLVVDMDGTLIKVDSLQEAFAQLLFRQPLQALRALLAIKDGRAAFKASVAGHVVPDTGTIPLEESVVEAIRQARTKGRKVYLATAADRRFADLVATSVGHFDGVFASENGVNLKGRRKAEYIVRTFGKGGFDYIGNDAADIPVWREARTAMISGASARELQHYKAEIPTLVSLNSRARSFGDYLRALRPQEWLKNALVAVPAVVVARDPTVQTATLLAFASFCFAASAMYLLNDVLDVGQDRTHPDKRHRPLASGIVPLSNTIGLFGLSVALAALFSFFSSIDLRVRCHCLCRGCHHLLAFFQEHLRSRCDCARGALWHPRVGWIRSNRHYAFILVDHRVRVSFPQPGVSTSIG